jgi:hypothetical protein
MEFKYKLVAVAVLALLAGTAFAAPMLIAPLDVKPYPRVSEGPKADYSIDLVYANFGIVGWERNQTVQRLVANFTTGNFSYVNVTEPIKYTNITYTVVANITNLSDLDAKMYETSYAAAQNINVIDSALGGVSLSRGIIDEPNFGGVVDGIWLDGKWLNTTWIPGKDYPLNMLRVMDQNHKALPTIPDLPANASEEGTWIEGVPIAEYFNSYYYSSTHLIVTQIYINGAWVDVTGRVQPDNPQPMVLANNTLVNLVLTSSTPMYKNVGNASVGPITAFPGWGQGVGQTYRYAGTNGFDKTWLAHQSKLVVFTGTQTFLNSESINESIACMENGSIDLYGSFTSYINNMPVNGTYYNTMSTATWLNTVQLQSTPNGYLYNAILTGNQGFQISPNGVEVYIKQGN